MVLGWHVGTFCFHEGSLIFRYPAECFGAKRTDGKLGGNITSVMALDGEDLDDLTNLKP